MYELERFMLVGKIQIIRKFLSKNKEKPANDLTPHPALANPPSATNALPLIANKNNLNNIAIIVAPPSLQSLSLIKVSNIWPIIPKILREYLASQNVRN
jgi:hypothetical protein